MPVISGFYAQDGLGQYDSPYISTDLEAYTSGWINSLANWLSPRAPGAAPLTSALPVSTTPLAVDGWRAKAHVDDFYYRIHVVPRNLDIGNLLSVQTREASVWNAWPESRQLSAINETGTDGIDESGIVAPSTFAPLQEQTLTLSITRDGPAVMNATYTFVFPAESPTLTVTGRRVVVFGHPPNWVEPVTERLEWLTDVMLTQGGIEQRIGLRNAPRRALAYDLLTADRNQTNQLETVLLGWQSRAFAVPVWTERQDLSAALAAGSLSIPCATSGYEFADNGLALLWLAHDKHEAIEIASVGASSLTLKSATVSAWPVGTRLYPVRLGRLAAQQKFTRETGRMLTGRVEFAFEDNPALTADDTGDVYAGYRVYAARTNWTEPVEIEFTRQVETIDFDTGTPWVDDLSGFAALVKSWHWTLSSRAEVVAFRQWLAAREGRRVPFWSVSQAEDIEVINAIGASDMVITIRNIGYARYLNGRADRRHIAIKTLAGAMYYRRITGATELSDTSEQLAVDSALGVLLNPAEIESVRFLHLTRLETDTVEIDWHHLGLAECRTLMRSLPQ